MLLKIDTLFFENWIGKMYIMSTSHCGREMPRYECHNEVWALKIERVVTKEDGHWAIIPEDEGYVQFDISNEYHDKHNPTMGGYYVVYKGGYKSFFPAGAFEDGYKLIK